MRHRLTTDDCIKGGKLAGRIAAEKPGFLDSIRTPESCRLCGLRGGAATAASGKLADVGLGIKTVESLRAGGKTQGGINARIGWMGHLTRVRYKKSHDDCPYCLNMPPKETKRE
jgi:hypothetical protein